MMTGHKVVRGGAVFGHVHMLMLDRMPYDPWMDQPLHWWGRLSLYGTTGDETEMEIDGQDQIINLMRHGFQDCGQGRHRYQTVELRSITPLHN